MTLLTRFKGVKAATGKISALKDEVYRAGAHEFRSWYGNSGGEVSAVVNNILNLRANELGVELNLESAPQVATVVMNLLNSKGY